MPWDAAPPSASLFALGSGVAWLAVVVLGATLRSRTYALARGILLAIHCLVAHALWSRVGSLWPLFLYGHTAVFVQSAMLVRPRMRSLAYRLLVSWPDAFFQGGTFMSFPLAIAFGLGFEPGALWFPYALALLGMVQSWRRRPLERVDLVVADVAAVRGLARVTPGEQRAERPLRIAQLTDTHLGPFMSAARLRDITARAVAAAPDLVMLTGDFLTMESQSDPAVLTHALEPLRALPGRVFACVGNHDLEAPDTVRRALGAVGARLLVDEAVSVDTPAGRVQIVGVDFRWRRRAEHLERVCREHPREPGALRVVLLHDPGAFAVLPEGEGDLVLSGHTHGGQVGLVSAGLPYTFMRLFTSSPDHGFWGRGTDRLYVHRGTGHYGFPVRLGVPAEESVLHVHSGRRTIATS